LKRGRGISKLRRGSRGSQWQLVAVGKEAISESRKGNELTRGRRDNLHKKLQDSTSGRHRKSLSWVIYKGVNSLKPRR